MKNTWPVKDVGENEFWCPSCRHSVDRDEAAWTEPRDLTSVPVCFDCGCDLEPYDEAEALSWETPPGYD